MKSLKLTTKPQRCYEVLTKLQKAGVSAAVAGGWCRDIVLGVEPKDIDIFLFNCPDTIFETPVHREIIKNHLIGTFEVRGIVSKEYEGCNLREDVLWVLVGNSMDIIAVKGSLLETVSNFDCSICMCYGVVNGNKIEIFVSDDFLDYKEKKIIYSYDGVKVREAHKLRIEEKYPDATWEQKSQPSKIYTKVMELDIDSKTN